MTFFRSTIVASLVLLASATDQTGTSAPYTASPVIASPVVASPITLSPALVTFAPFTIAPAEPPISPVADSNTTTAPVTPVGTAPFAPSAPVAPPTIGPLPPGVSLPPALSAFPELGVCAVCGEGKVVEMADVLISLSGFNFSCGDAQLAGEIGAFPTFACVSEVTNGIILANCGCVDNTTQASAAPGPTPGAAPEAAPGAAPGVAPGAAPTSNARYIASLTATAIIGSLILPTMLNYL